MSVGPFLERRPTMKINVPINQTDIIILIILAILFVIGIRIVIGFFKKPEHRDTQDRQEEAAESDTGRTR